MNNYQIKISLHLHSAIGYVSIGDIGKMTLDAAETVFGYFGFDRTVYGNKKSTGERKWRWLQELIQEREKDIRTEML